MDCLVNFNQLVDWQGFRDMLNLYRKKDRKSNAERRAFDV